MPPSYTQPPGTERWECRIGEVSAADGPPEAASRRRRTIIAIRKIAGLLQRDKENHGEAKLLQR